MKRCRHTHYWILGTPLRSMLWCYWCGAIRVNMPKDKWIRPTGIGGKNPYKFVKKPEK